MGKLLYYLIVWIYNLILQLSAPFNSKASKIIQGRKESFKKISKTRNKGEGNIWIHCASLGEFEQGRPVIEKIKSHFPDFRVYLSFFSSSGYEVQSAYVHADCVFYLPSDSPGNAEKLIEIVSPELVIIVKYEFWYHYIKACFDRAIPILSISTILRPSQPFFKWYGGFYLDILKMFTHFFVQNRETENLLNSKGISQVTLSGDTRFDRVAEIARSPKRIEKVAVFKGDSGLIVLGSSWNDDIDLWKEYINSTTSWKFVIAPHNVNDDTINYIEKNLTCQSTRFSS